MVHIKHACRFAIVFVTSKFWVCFFIIATLPLGQAMGIPVLQVNKHLILVLQVIKHLFFWTIFQVALDITHNCAHPGVDCGEALHL